MGRGRNSASDSPSEFTYTPTFGGDYGDSSGPRISSSTSTSTSTSTPETSSERETPASPETSTTTASPTDLPPTSEELWERGIIVDPAARNGQRAATEDEINHAGYMPDPNNDGRYVLRSTLLGESRDPNLYPEDYQSVPPTDEEYQAEIEQQRLAAMREYGQYADDTGNIDYSQILIDGQSFENLERAAGGLMFGTLTDQNVGRDLDLRQLATDWLDQESQEDIAQLRANVNRERIEQSRNLSRRR